MGSYYYLMSSLPDLSADAEAPIGYEDFLNMCESNVSDGTLDQLRQLTPSQPAGCIASEWTAFCGVLNKELNSQRSARLGKPYPQGYEKEPEASAAAAAALAARNPLEAEKIILKFQFEQLDRILGLHMFDEEALFCYAMKLRLLERAGRFEHDKGKKEFTKLFEQVQESIRGV